MGGKKGFGDLELDLTTEAPQGRKSLTVYVTDEEKEILQRAAGKALLNLSSYIRARLIKIAKVELGER